MHQLFQSIFKKLLLCLLLSPSVMQAQLPITVESYIETYKELAMAEMRRSGIPASIKLAQAILESGFGNSELAVNANNHFGIKCHDWTGRTYFYDDDAPNECFRVYNSPVQSFLDHSAFLTTRPRYNFLFQLDPLNYEAWARGLSQAGYATNPSYPQLLINLINNHQLYQYDRKAMDSSYILADARKAPESDRSTKEIRNYNRIKYVVAGAGDNPESIADEMDMRTWQIVKYNDMEESHQVQEGDRIYLQPKRRRGSVNHHVAREGETMLAISQRFGVRLENLYRRNDMTFDMEPEPGQRMLLRGYKGSFTDYLFRRP